MNAGLIRKAPEAPHEGVGRKGDGSWEVRDILLNKPIAETDEKLIVPEPG